MIMRGEGSKAKANIGFFRIYTLSSRVSKFFFALRDVHVIETEIDGFRNMRSCVMCDVERIVTFRWLS